MTDKKMTKKQLLRELEELKKKNEELTNLAQKNEKKLKSLKAAGKKYRQIFEMESDAVLFMDNSTGKIMEANKAASFLYGYNHKELLKLTITDLSAEPEKTGDAITQKHSFVKLRFHKKKDGTVFPVEITGTHFKKQGRTVNIGMFRDISERLRDKEEIERQRAFLNSVIESSPSFIYVKDRKGTFVITNNNWSKNFGLPPEQLIGKTVFDIFSDKDIALSMHNDDLAIFSHKSVKIEREEKYTDNSRNLKWLYTVKTPMYDGSGNVEYIIGISIDITARKHAENILREREHDYRSLIESSTDAIYVLAENRFVLVNSSWEKLFGYSSKEVISEDFDLLKIVAPESIELIKSRFEARSKNQPVGKRYRMRGITKAGKIIDLEVSIADILWNGKPALQGIYRDISDIKKTEEALRREAYIFDNLHDAIIITDNDGNVLNWNASACSMFGYSKEEILNRPTELLIKNSEPYSLTAHILDMVKKEGRWSGEINFVRKDRCEGISETVVVPFFDSQGEQVAVLGVNRDITASKQAIEALKESEQKFKELTDLLPQTVFEMDLQGRLTFVNQESFKYFGYSKEDFEKGLSVLDMIISEDRERAFENLNKAMREEKMGETEYTAVRKDGTTFPVLIFSKAIFRNGRHLGWRGILIDISERIEAEEQLRKFSRAVEQSANSIVITDTKGNIEYVNQRFTDLTGYGKDEVMGRNPRVLKSGETSVVEYKKLWDTITRGKIWRGQFHNKKKSGELYWEEASISPIQNQKGQTTHFLAIKEDITRRKEIERELILAKEKAEESDRLKSEFLAQMSHEIRSPLNIILSYNAFLREEFAGKINNDMESSFSSIDSAGKRLLRTIDLILNMSAVQSGLEVKLSPIDISPILSDLIKEFEFPAAEKKLKLTFYVDAPQTLISGDDYIVMEIFQNLIGNAVKYTQHGEVSVKIYDDTDSKLSVDIQDTGIGISEDYLPKIFQPFTQEDTGYSRKFEGNGLGLALVLNYLKMINAEIAVNSSKGKGSLFTVKFDKFDG